MNFNFLQNILPGFLQPMSGALSLILLPAAATVIGGLLVLLFNVSQKLMTNIFHFAAGLLLGIVGIELIPEFIKHPQEWLIILIFVIGGAAFLLVDWLTDLVSEKLDLGSKKGKSPWIIFMGMSIDLLSDGMLIASGASLGNLGFPLAIATAVVALPEAFTSAAVFKKRGFGTWKLVGIAFAQAFFQILGVPIGYLIVHGHPEIFTYGLLSFTAGFLSVMLTEEMLPRAHEGKDARLGAFLFLIGFAVVALVSAYIG